MTERLELVPASLPLLEAALESAASLAVRLEAEVPSSWPPEYVDRAALTFTVERIRQAPTESTWWMYFFVRRADGASRRRLIGSGGYKGPPSADGTVEVGYGIVTDERRRSFASEAVGGLLDHAFACQAVSRVIAETLPELVPSIGVLQKRGFRCVGAGSEPGVIRFELTRSAYTRSPDGALP